AAVARGCGRTTAAERFDQHADNLAKELVQENLRDADPLGCGICFYRGLAALRVAVGHPEALGTYVEATRCCEQLASRTGIGPAVQRESADLWDEIGQLQAGNPLDALRAHERAYPLRHALSYQSGRTA